MDFFNQIHDLFNLTEPQSSLLNTEEFEKELKKFFFQLNTMSMLKLIYKKVKGKVSIDWRGD